MRKAVSVVLFLILFLSQCSVAEERQTTLNWYEIFVRSYADSDGDGLGDLNGVTEKLSYIHSLGFDGLWLMPIMPSPSYHKYDVTDYFSVDPEYGTLEDLQNLVKACHDLGMRIIIDLSINHTSDRHPWFMSAVEAIRRNDLEDPHIQYYHFFDSSARGRTRLDGTDLYYEEQFAGGGMPDLDLDNENVRSEILRMIDFWLVGQDVDGFRLDTVINYHTGDHDENIRFLKWFRESCQEARPNVFLVGEAWSSLDTIAKYYESGLDCLFLFPASQAEGGIIRAMRARKPAESFAKFLSETEEALDGHIAAPFLSNHDTGRTIGSVQGRGDAARAKFVEGLLGIFGGYTFTYYGEEIGMSGSGVDPNKRLAMNWSVEERTEQPPGADVVEYPYPGAYEQQEDPDSILNYVANVNHMRLSCPAVALGKTEVLQAEGTTFFFKRSYGENTVYVCVNFSSKEALDLPLPDDVALLFDLETGSDACKLDSGSLHVPAYGIVVLG